MCRAVESNERLTEEMTNDQNEKRLKATGVMEELEIELPEEEWEERKQSLLCGKKCDLQSSGVVHFTLQSTASPRILNGQRTLKICTNAACVIC